RQISITAPESSDKLLVEGGHCSCITCARHLGIMSASCSDPADGNIQWLRMWDLNAMHDWGSIKAPVYRRLRINAGGQWIIAAGTDSAAYVLDLASGSVVKPLKGHDGMVWDADGSADGTRVVTCGHDRTIRMWDAESGAQVWGTLPYGAEITCVRFLPDGE